jgi:predicted lipid-binding transport protein (Tim44 family)
VLSDYRRRAASRCAAQARAALPDTQAMLAVARQSFMQMQAAWDVADMHALAACTTAPVLADLTQQLRQRGPGPNRTEVLQLDAKLLALDDLTEALVASVEFSGVIRERANRAEAPFRELWLLAKAKQDIDGWRLAAVQSLS